MNKQVILIVLIVLATVAAIGGLHVYRTGQTARYIAHPKTGDVYTLTNTWEDIGTRYYFLKVGRINGDTLFMYHSGMSYDTQYGPLAEDDYFVKDEVLFYNRAALKGMYDKGVLILAERDYPLSTGYNREQPPSTLLLDDNKKPLN